MHQVQGNFEAQMGMFDKKFTIASPTICETYRTYFILTRIAFTVFSSWHYTNMLLILFEVKRSIISNKLSVSFIYKISKLFWCFIDKYLILIVVHGIGIDRLLKSNPTEETNLPPAYSVLGI